jgi:hypothetical protein
MRRINGMIAGFVWFQGYNDQFGENARKEYGTNLVHLIQDLRTEFEAPEMKVVVGPRLSLLRRGPLFHLARQEPRRDDA